MQLPDQLLRHKNQLNLLLGLFSILKTWHGFYCLLLDSDARSDSVIYILLGCFSLGCQPATGIDKRTETNAVAITLPLRTQMRISLIRLLTYNGSLK